MECTVRWTGSSGMTFLAETGSGHVVAMDGAPEGGGRTLAQGALAWLWGRSPRTVPIPGFRSVAQAEENAGALAKGPLTGQQMAEAEHILQRTRQATGAA